MERTDPYQGFNFYIEISGIVSGGFSECSGLEVETELLEFREGGVNGFLHRFNGPAKHPPLVLKRGLTDKQTLWDWHQQVVAGDMERKNISVVLRDAAGEEALRWDFREAFPVKWTGPALKATAGDVAVESIEFVHRGFRKSE